MPMTYTTPKKPIAGSSRRRIAGERSRRPAGADGATPSSSAGQVESAAAPTAQPVRSGQSPQAAADSPQSGAQPPSRWLLALAGVLLVALLVEAALVAWHWAGNDERAEAAAVDAAIQHAPARAEQAATALLSYSYDGIDQAIDKTTPFLTAQYAKDYTATMRDVVAEPARQTQATVTATVLSTGVVNADADQVEVLVFVDQTTESAASDQPKTALNRAVLTMVERDGEWVVSNLKGF